MTLLSGVRAWTIQRLSAVVLLLVLPLLLYSAAQIEVLDYEHWHAWAGGGLNPVWIVSAFTALLFHCWIGFRDVLLDYIHPYWLRVTLLGVVASALIVLGLWLVLILVRIQ